MFGYKHYVPILKWKRGEQVGLKHCTEEIKSGMTPLMEIPPVPWNFDKEAPAKTVDEHIESIPETILDSWGSERRFFLDASQISFELCVDGTLPLARVIENARALELRMTPTINMQTPGPELEVIAEAIKKDQNGVCLRIAEDDMEDDLIFRNMVNQLLENLDVSFDSVDLIIDLAYKPEPVKPLYVRSLINDIIFNHSRWRTFTLTCTSFPVNMSEIERDSLEALYRIEWDLWEKLLAHHASNRLERMPAYSDYCVANPEAIEIDPKLMNPSGHIRYTIQDEFLIVKGGAVRDVKRGGVVVAKGRKYAQMVGLCKTLINRPEFCGSGFSWGDQYIQDCANGIVSHGNPETWRRVATNHHLTFVVDQLANYPALSAAQ